MLPLERAMDDGQIDRERASLSPPLQKSVGFHRWWEDFVMTGCSFDRDPCLLLERRRTRQKGSERTKLDVGWVKFQECPQSDLTFVHLSLSTSLGILTSSYSRFFSTSRQSPQMKTLHEKTTHSIISLSSLTRPFEPTWCSSFLSFCSCRGHVLVRWEGDLILGECSDDVTADTWRLPKTRSFSLLVNQNIITATFF